MRYPISGQVARTQVRGIYGAHSLVGEPELRFVLEFTIGAIRVSRWGK